MIMDDKYLLSRTAWVLKDINIVVGHQNYGKVRRRYQNIVIARPQDASRRRGTHVLACRRSQHGEGMAFESIVEYNYGRSARALTQRRPNGIFDPEGPLDRLDKVR